MTTITPAPKQKRNRGKRSKSTRKPKLENGKTVKTIDEVAREHLNEKVLDAIEKIQVEPEFGLTVERGRIRVVINTTVKKFGLITGAVLAALIWMLNNSEMLRKLLNL